MYRADAVKHAIFMMEAVQAGCMWKRVALAGLGSIVITVITLGAVVGVAMELGRLELAVTLAIALLSVAVASIRGGAISGHGKTPYW